ncbi:cc-nbs-lrr resistance protein [Corchorus capsularis]|uniref:Cc-nbs-lrr resistance protein n=1 Tax=Corchorus capsularis TaxID=210143 RepID=A0A1R3IDH2_COCAP|nr:cc-nbs-lrr resistance protein [Corchorus capsularis]
MDSIVSVVVQTCGCILCFVFRTITTLSKLHHNTIKLQKDIEKLDARKKDIEDEVGLGEKEGKCPTAQVKEWLRKVEELEGELQPMLETADQISGQGCNPSSCNININSRYQLSRNMAKKSIEVKQLIDSCCFDTVVTDKKSPVRAVERKHGTTCLTGQSEAEEMIEKVMELLKGDGNRRVAFWGMGGVGKTTLLSVVKLRLDKVDSDELVLDAAWLKGLREFNIQITPRSRHDSNHNQPTQHDEKRAILRGIDLMEMGKGLKGLLSTVKNLEEIRVRNCRRMKCIISGKVSTNMIPKLRDMASLKTICSRVPAWPPALDLVEVRNCPLLIRIPFPISNEEKIKGDSQFLSNVAWHDDDDKMECGFQQ